jgi:hypothetical protein
VVLAGLVEVDIINVTEDSELFPLHTSDVGTGPVGRANAGDLKFFICG